MFLVKLLIISTRPPFIHILIISEISYSWRSFNSCGWYFSFGANNRGLFWRRYISIIINLIYFFNIFWANFWIIPSFFWLWLIHFLLRIFFILIISNDYFNLCWEFIVFDLLNGFSVIHLRWKCSIWNLCLSYSFILI